MKRSVLVTGASGFVGVATVAALAEQGWQVRAAARNPASIVALSGVERVAMPNLAASADWSPLLAGVSHVVHLAAHAHGVVPGRRETNAVARMGVASRERVLARFSAARVNARIFVVLRECLE